jgi:hypothetical protein
VTRTHAIPDAALERDIAILGKKGKGKTYAAKGLVERLLDLGRRVVVVDPMGVWWGLRTAADGKRPGYRIAVFGGDHGDMPLVDEMARPLARVLASENLPAVLDLADMRKAGIIRFATAFFDELYAANRDPLWLVLEEADLFAPQNPMGDTAQLLGEVDRIARRGRAFGFRLITMSQRPARLHKDVLTQLSTLVALGLTSPQDREALRAWVEGNADRDLAREVFDTLAKLETGEAWVWAPDLDMLERVRLPAIRTLDTSATPKAGDERKAAKTLAEIDVGPIREALAAAGTPSPLVGEGRGGGLPSDLKERLAEAERRGFARGERHGRDEERAKGSPYLELARGKAFEEGKREGYKEGRSHGHREGANAQMRRVVEALAGAAMLNGDAEALGSLQLQKVKFTSEAPPTDRPEGESPPAGPPPEEAAARVDIEVNAEGLTPAKRRILVALRQLEAIGQAAPEKANVAWFAGASPKSSAFSNNLGAMRSAGLIDYPSGGTVALADAGRDAAPPVAAPSHAEIMDLVRAKLAPAQARMLQAAVAVYPLELPLEQLAERAGQSLTSSSFSNNRGRLRSLGLITYPRPGHVRAADVLFP